MPIEAQLMPRQSTPDAHEEADYWAFHAALSESERGRDFLADYARRNRNADTTVLLAALDRLEVLMRADAAALAQQREELRMLLIAIRMLRSGADRGATIEPEKLSGMLDMLERRIDTMIAGPAPVFAARPVTTDFAPAESIRPALAMVPPLDEPELPIPTPAAALPPPIVLVAGAPRPSPSLDLEWASGLIRAAQREQERPVQAEPAAAVWQPLFGEAKEASAAVVVPTMILPEISFVGATPPRLERAAISPAQSRAAKPETPPAAAPPQPAGDPLAEIMALSNEERIALFT